MSAVAVNTQVLASDRVADYIALIKPRVTSMVSAATVVGFYLAQSGPLTGNAVVHLISSAVGMCFLVGGANAMNQVLERRYDARMLRTADRPLAAGRVAVRAAVPFAMGLSLFGLLLLAVLVDWTTTGLAFLAWVSYVLAYTPLKRLAPAAILVGAIPGALPPVIGWAAAGPLDARALVPFAIMYVWQLPHFLAIAWLHRDDYAQAGYRMLPVVKPDGRRTFVEMILYSVLLIPVSLLPTVVGMAGMVYYFGASVLGCAFLVMGIELARLRTRRSALRHLLGSLAYLTLLFVLMSVDKIPS